MPKYKRYRVAHLFAIDGKVFTNDDEAAIRELPAKMRQQFVDAGNLVEYEADAPPPASLSEVATATTKSKE